tara:strand:- start:520 stop:1710 length:1191 start_codon:yes stop_codon:yes gene_type:complete
MDIKFGNYNNSSSSTLTFDVTNSNTSFVNSLRRIIITHITTIGFDTEDYNNSDLKVIKNTSSLHNEFLLHRIGMIPVHSTNVPEYDPSNYKFTLNVKNKSQKIINITTNDFVITNLISNIKEDNEIFFPRNTITNDHILIIRLKPGNDGNGEHIHIEGKSSKGIGITHIKYSPVSNVLFTNKIDESKKTIALNKYLEGSDETNVEELTHKFNLEESQRYFHTNEEGDPNQFEFKIESRGVLEPYIILLEGLKQMLFKIINFTVEFEKSILNNDSTIEIKDSPSIMKAFDITVNNETHTLGHVLQSFVNLINVDKDIFVGYINPHPLEQKIVFRVKVSNKDILKSVFNETTNKLIQMYETLISNVEKEFTIVSTKTKSKKKKFIVSGKKSQKLKVEP